MQKQYPRAKHLGSSWALAPNTVWNVPADIHTLVGKMTTNGPWSAVISYRALAVDRDGYVYGMRTLHKPRESGHELEGSVSIDGKKFRAFTSSQLFERPDGSLIDVATLYVCKPDGPLPLPNLDSAPDEVLQELASRYHYASDDSRALIRDYAQYTLYLRQGYAGHFPHVGYPARREEIYAALPQWAKFR